MMRYRDRRDAGRQLADALRGSVSGTDAVVLGLPRGGVPVAYELAVALTAPLDIFLVRKLGVPGHEELAMGAIASGGIRILNRDVIADLHVPPEEVERVTAAERSELQRRERVYRGTRPEQSVEGKTVFLVDDGLATGATMAAAVEGLRTQRPRRIIAAVPVASREAVNLIERRADRCVALFVPNPFYGVGTWYTDFTQTSDDEVRALLQAAAREISPASRIGAASGGPAS